MFQISKMEAFLGKWKMDYDACEGYDEFMTAEVNKIAIKCNLDSHSTAIQNCNSRVIKL